MIVKFHRILYKHRSREVGHELITGNFDGNNTGSYRISVADVDGCAVVGCVVGAVVGTSPES